MTSRLFQTGSKTSKAVRLVTESSNLRSGTFNNEVFSLLELRQRDFGRAALRNAEFVSCDLRDTSFIEADLSGANFRAANLENVDFSSANLSKANFYGANLKGAVFLGSNLYRTIFREAIIGRTTFSNVELETWVGLEKVIHASPSSVGVECLYRAGNNLPIKFFEGVGLGGILIDYLPSLIQAGSPIQFHSCFVSYSHTDEAFARMLWERMRKQKIRVWYAPEEMKGGRKIYEQIDHAIQVHDKLIIVLSNESIKSHWVETEIRRARRQEVTKGERKLFPLRLCDMANLKQWVCFDSDSGRDIAVEVRDYHIPDFSRWRNDNEFEKAFERLCRDLRRVGVEMQEPSK